MMWSPVAAVEIAAADGAVLRGQLWPGTKAWVVLLHDCGEDEDEDEDEDLDRWLPLAPHLAARDWTVLAADLRGHGASDGEWDPALAEADLAALVDFARSRGAAYVAVVAAGASAITALRSAAATRPNALVILSPSLGPDEPLTGLRGAGEAKLFVVGGGDGAARTAAERLAKAAIGWGLLVNLPAAAQGTALLGGAVASHLREHVTGFLAEQRFLAGNRPGWSHAGQRARPDRAPAGGAETTQRSDNG